MLGGGGGGNSIRTVHGRMSYSIIKPAVKIGVAILEAF